ncbi:MAG: stage IV sporulation protein A [Oscillospiraceae bacterium]
MTTTSIYQDIANRTAGDIYIGVVGPVRTGKSTFIKRFMESQVIPNIDNVYRRERAKDELPQSGSGRTIMTAEPKFVPEEAVEISLGDGGACSVRMIDCVGYLVNGALGHTEEELPRMVTTPWFDHEIPMTEAAELGTRKVIREHSTIGVVVTTDGSVTELAREDYVPAEERVIRELKELQKPFVVLLNSAHPGEERTKAIAADIAARHGVRCLPVNCLTLSDGEVEEILKAVLYEFPLVELDVFLPPWVDALQSSHSIKTALFETIRSSAEQLSHLREVEELSRRLGESEGVERCEIRELRPDTGVGALDLTLPRQLFYATLSEQSGFGITDDGDLLTLLTELAGVKKEYDRVKTALRDVRETGYGIVVPGLDELKLEEPEIMKQGGRYGVRLRASAPSIHMESIKQKCNGRPGAASNSRNIVKYFHMTHRCERRDGMASKEGC